MFLKERLIYMDTRLSDVFRFRIARMREAHRLALKRRAVLLGLSLGVISGILVVIFELAASALLLGLQAECFVNLRDSRPWCLLNPLALAPVAQDKWWPLDRDMAILTRPAQGLTNAVHLVESLLELRKPLVHGLDGAFGINVECVPAPRQTRRLFSRGERL